MTKQDKQIIFETSSKTLAKWYCKLNRWEWPDGLPDPEIDTIPRVNSTRRDEIMVLIKAIIGAKAASRAWNSAMTDDQFEEFWQDFAEGTL